MDWIAGIQRAIDYAEKHLEEEIDFEACAKEACSSAFHFQRIFSVLCGYTFGEYIRMRRLAKAAEDLAHGGCKVIDTALKYGYDTPESFTRAFVRFHGITPSDARHGGKIRTFTPLSVKLILTGGTSMEYRIEKKDAVQVICKRKLVSKPQNATPGDISAFWDECIGNGTLKRIIAYMPEKLQFGGLLGICFSSDMEYADGLCFPYGIGMEYDGRKVTDEDLEIFTIPEQTYAVFPVRGKMPDAFAQTYGRIVSEFFPQSDRYAYDSSTELEVYPSDDLDNPDYACEIWIAVKDK